MASTWVLISSQHLAKPATQNKVLEKVTDSEWDKASADSDLKQKTKKTNGFSHLC
jgi:hypothetical protein